MESAKVAKLCVYMRGMGSCREPLESDAHGELRCRIHGAAGVGRSSVPLTDGQREAIEAPLSRMSVAELVANHSNLRSFEDEHGTLPDELRQAWCALELAVGNFDAALRACGVQR